MPTGNGSGVGELARDRLLDFSSSARSSRQLVRPLSLDLRIATTEAGQSAPSSVSAVLAFVLLLPLLLPFKSITLLPLLAYRIDICRIKCQKPISGGVTPHQLGPSSSPLFLSVFPRFSRPRISVSNPHFTASGHRVKTGSPLTSLHFRDRPLRFIKASVQQKKPLL